MSNDSEDTRDEDTLEEEVLDGEELFDGEEEGYSLEELSQAYANVIQGPDDVHAGDQDQTGLHNSAVEEETSTSLEDQVAVSPHSIVEAVLFVGCPDDRSLTANEMAKLMRGVESSEIAGIVQDLNETYAVAGSALRIGERSGGYALDIADEMEFIRERFYGKVREIRLNQAAIDCLALIAYQPGISRKQLEDQRGQPSGGVLNQLVRRQLIEIERKPVDGRQMPHYFPTDKLLQLASLESLDDLPQVEDFG